jgi:hypothetical protein
MLFPSALTFLTLVGVSSADATNGGGLTSGSKAGKSLMSKARLLNNNNNDDSS